MKQWVALALGALAVVGAAATLWPSRGDAPSVEEARRRLALPPPQPPVKLTPAASKRAEDDPENSNGEGDSDSEGPPPEGLDRPKRPTRAEIEGAMARVESAVLQCRHLEEASGTITVRLEFAPSGGVQSSTVLPPFSDTKTGQCVQKATSQARLPPFQPVPTPTVQVTYPYYFAPSD